MRIIKISNKQSLWRHSVKISIIGRSQNTWPVEVQVRQLVGELLKLVRVQVRRVVNNVVVHGCHRSLSDLLRDEEKVVHVATRDFRIDDRARMRIVFFILLVAPEEPLIDPLFQHNVGDLRFPARILRLLAFNVIVDWQRGHLLPTGLFRLLG